MKAPNVADRLLNRSLMSSVREYSSFTGVWQAIKLNVIENKSLLCKLKGNRKKKPNVLHDMATVHVQVMAPTHVLNTTTFIQYHTNAIQLRMFVITNMYINVS